MTKTHCCDQCGKLIKDSDIRITLYGFLFCKTGETRICLKAFRSVSRKIFAHSPVCLNGH